MPDGPTCYTQAPMNILSLESVSKAFGSGTLLDGVSFGLAHDEKMGVIGRNGCGKTTLLRLIAGTEQPDTGRVTLANGKTVAFVAQNPEFRRGQSVLDALFDQASPELRLLREYEAACAALASGGDSHDKQMERVAELSHRLDATGGWALEALARSILGRLGITDTAADTASLSGGLRRRVALARGLILRPDLLILDEPTNHLDADTIEWLEEYLSEYKGALLLVTHDRYFLDRVTNRILEIEGGRIQRFEGCYSYYLEKKAEQEAQRDAEARKHENLIRRELAWLRQGAKARSTKQKAHVERAKAVVTGPKPKAERQIELSSASSRLGNKILELDGIGKSYGGNRVLDGFSYRLKAGDRIGIIGPNGSGKTTLLHIISGKLHPDSGTIARGDTAVIGYFEQEPDLYAGTGKRPDEELRVIDFVKAIAEQIPTADGGVISASQMLERFLFSPQMQYSPVARLSGGERRRLALLKLLMGAPNVLLLDEPTNDFDIATLVALETYLESFPGCLIVASHDRAFLDRTIDQIFRIGPGGRLKGYPGNFTTYLELAAAETPPEAPALPAQATPVAESAPSRSERPARQKLSFKERRELDEIVTRIAASEARKAEIEGLLAAPSGGFETMKALSDELELLTQTLDTDLERWTELAERE